MTTIAESHRRLTAETGGTNRTISGAGDAILDEGYDTSMLIILVVLLFALLLALGLNLIVRCGLQHCLIRPGLDTIGNRGLQGLKKGELSRIPVAVYRSISSVACTECPICLGEFADGERVRVLPGCGHGFHVWCIDAWLVSHSSCPNCRASLLEV